MLEAVTQALRDWLDHLRRTLGGRSLADELEAIGRECAALPVLDPRPADVILGYDRDGLPRVQAPHRNPLTEWSDHPRP